ncbi:MAG: M56 family metallopeptidase [Saprospiraceae bacterium]|nr:M56 family metallopeptidase [Saprospiraceae bacterium]
MKNMEVTNAFAWQELFAATLIHSLWQGAIIVLVLWMLRLICKKDTRLQYVLSFIALIVFLFLNLFTFFYLLNQKTFSFYPSELISNWLNTPEVLKWVNQIWLIGALVFLTRFVFSHFYIKRLINKSSPLQDQIWNKLFQNLKNYYSIKKSIVLLESEKIGSAFLTGVLKPVIIIPTSWINQLSEQEAECILAHELSHVYNKDHWTNLLMNLIEIIYFFNPAVHILLSHLKLERELVADASVCNYLKTPIQYAKLILKIEESSGFIPAFSLPFFRQKNQLKKRIETVLKIKTPKNDFLSSLATASILVCLLFSTKGFMNTQIIPATMNDSHLSINTENEINTISINKIPEEKKFQKIQTPLKPKKYKKSIPKIPAEKIFSNQDLVYTPIEDENENIFKRIEINLTKELNLSHKVFSSLNNTSHTDTMYSLDGGSLILPTQLKCYAPNESKTFIIIRNITEKEIQEFEYEDNDQGMIQHDLQQTD